MFKDLYGGSSEKYWKNEGNNKRMRNYCKLSKILKIVKFILIFALALYCIMLSSDSIFCLYDKLICCDTNINLLNFIDFKKFVIDIYIVTFIISLFVVLYYGRKQKYSLKKIIFIILNSLTFLPIAVLLVYNFVVLGSLMSSFYLLVVFSVVIFIINQLTSRIDRLFEIAVGSIEINGKGDKKVCKGK